MRNVPTRQAQQPPRCSCLRLVRCRSWLGVLAGTGCCAGRQSHDCGRRGRSGGSAGHSGGRRRLASRSGCGRGSRCGASAQCRAVHQSRCARLAWGQRVRTAMWTVCLHRGYHASRARGKQDPHGSWRDRQQRRCPHCLRGLRRGPLLPRRHGPRLRPLPRRQVSRLLRGRSWDALLGSGAEVRALPCGQDNAWARRVARRVCTRRSVSLGACAPGARLRADHRGRWRRPACVGEQARRPQGGHAAAAAPLAVARQQRLGWWCRRAQQQRLRGEYSDAAANACTANPTFLADRSSSCCFNKWHSARGGRRSPALPTDGARRVGALQPPVWRAGHAGTSCYGLGMRARRLERPGGAAHHAQAAVRARLGRGPRERKWLPLRASSARAGRGSAQRARSDTAAEAVDADEAERGRCCLHGSSWLQERRLAGNVCTAKLAHSSCHGAHTH